MAVGGEDNKLVLRSVECYDPLAHCWRSLSCLPFAVRLVYLHCNCPVFYIEVGTTCYNCHCILCCYKLL